MAIGEQIQQIETRIKNIRNANFAVCSEQPGGSLTRVTSSEFQLTLRVQVSPVL